MFTNFPKCPPELQIVSETKYIIINILVCAHTVGHTNMCPLGIHFQDSKLIFIFKF